MAYPFTTEDGGKDFMAHKTGLEEYFVIRGQTPAQQQPAKGL